MNDILQRTREAIFEVFGEIIYPDDPEKTRREIERATRLGESGRDSQGVVVVIFSALILPSEDSIYMIEGWSTVSKMLGDHFVQTVNSEKSCVYKVV